MKALFAEDHLQSGNDYCHAAMVLQQNDRAARLLAAEAEDRFLTNIGRPQRFATQFTADGNGPWKLKPVDPVVTDNFRRLMDTPSLADAKNQEADLNKGR